MRTFLRAITVMFLLMASMMFWMCELVNRGIASSPVSSTRYFVAGILFGIVAIAGLRTAVEERK